MARKARLVVPGAVYHVMGRCLEQYRLFSDDSDREYFLSLLEKYLQRTGTSCYAWVLMDNHYHFVLRLGERELWELMKPLNMRYAQYHQKKTGRRGPLFMDRYKSIVTQDRNYVQELVRYVHLNPVRAGVCINLTALQRYPWCGHSVLMGTTVRWFQDTRSVLRRFGKDVETSRSAYCKYLESGLKKSGADDALITLVRRSNEGKEKGRKPHRWVIGDQKYVSSVLEKSEARRLRVSRFEREGGNFDSIEKKICGLFNIHAGVLRTRQRGGKGSDARKVFAYVSARHYQAPVHRVAEHLGVSNGAVSAMVHKGREIVDKRGVAI